MVSALVGFLLFGLMIVAFVVLLGGFVGWLLDRGAMGTGERPSSSGIGNALLEVQSMVEPGKRAVVEERRRDVHDEDDEGGPADAERVAGNVRRSLLQLLQVLANPRLQREWDAAELFCQWFDDLYLPDSDALELGFAPDERVALASFDEVMSKAHDALAGRNARQAELLARPEWQEVVRAATATLAAMDEAPRRGR